MATFRPLTALPQIGDRLMWINRSESDPMLWHVEQVSDNGHFVRITDRPTRPGEINQGHTFYVPVQCLWEPIPGTGPAKHVTVTATKVEVTGLADAHDLDAFIKIGKKMGLSADELGYLKELVNSAPNNGQRVMRGRNYLRNIAKKRG